MASTQVPFDRFVKHPELTELLRQLAAEHPRLVELSSIGTSHEGREIWLVTVTNQATGPHHEKPAFWVDADIHATELTGSVAALHLVHRLVSGYGTDDRVTRALDTRCFYVVPRLNPDGAELALAERPTYVRSSVGPYPTSEPEIRAVVQAIVDRQNICGYIAYHTAAGVHLRPYGTRADDQLPTADLRVYKVIGAKATALTGYPAASVFHEFRYDPKDNITGVADDWAYEHLGVFAWT